MWKPKQKQKGKHWKPIFWGERRKVRKTIPKSASNNKIQGTLVIDDILFEKSICNEIMSILFFK